MKKLLLLAAFVGIAALNVNAQAEGPESKTDKYVRLKKMADENPTDWKAQLELGHFLLDKDSGMYNQSQAVKYFERIYHQALDYNKAIPDSVISEAGMMMITVASDKKNLNEALFYVDELLRAKKVGVNIDNTWLNTMNSIGMLYSMMKEDFAKSLVYMLDFRNLVTESKLPGIEHTDITTSMIFEHLTRKIREIFTDKVMEVTFDNKKYIIIAMNEWNIEKPFMGWMQKDEDTPTLLCDEDGKVYDDIHGDMQYQFFFNKEGIVPQEGANARMITITPERRQQLIEAYHNYMKKAKKKNKK